MAIPSKYTVDRCLELDGICLVDAAGVHPEVLQPVSSRLFAAEPDLVEASLVLLLIVRAHQLGKNHLVCHPGMREDRISGNLAVR